MRSLRVLILVITTFLLCGGMAWGVPDEQPISQDRDAVSASQVVVLYSQAPSPSGGLLHSSLRDPDGSDTDRWVWDGFVLASTLDITEVQWRGGYDPLRRGSGGPVFDFIVDIYASIAAGTQPDLSGPPLVHYTVGGNANETPAEVLGGVQTYAYHYALPAPFQAAAGTKYWLQIEAYQSGAPDWGLSKASGGDGYYFRTDGYLYQIVPGDAAFALLAPGVDGYRANLGIVKTDSADPVKVGAVLTYTLAISNSGPDAATAVTITDTLPAGVILSHVSGSGWNCSSANSIVTCTRPALAVEAAPSIVIAVLAPANPGTITNTASIRSAIVDPDLGDNAAAESTRVEAGVSYQSFLPLVRRP